MPLLAAVVFFNMACYAQIGPKWAVGLNSISNGDGFGTNNNFPIVFYTDNTAWMWLTSAGSLGLGVSNPTNRFEVMGSARFMNNTYVDSLLTAGSLLVKGNSEFNGLLHIGGNLLIDGTNNLITSSSGLIGFGSNRLSTTGNLSADTLNGNALNVNSISTTDITASGQVQAGGLSVTGNSQFAGVSAQTLQADSLAANHINSATGNVQTLHATSILADTANVQWLDAATLLQNGSPVISSPWEKAGSNIYFQGGNVGVNTTVPAFPFEVHGNSAFAGTIFADRVAVQTGISIGQFRFTNGASTPGAADSIRTPAALRVQSADTLSITSAAVVQVQATGTVSIASAADTIKLDAATVVVAPPGVPVPPITTSPVALDVVGDARVNGNINANSIKVDTADFLRLKTRQITSSDTTSLGLIQFGDSTIYLSTATHRLLWVGAGVGTPTAQGFTIGNARFKQTGLFLPDFFCWVNQNYNQRAFAPNSMAIGYNLRVTNNADYAMVLGSGLTAGEPNNCTLNDFGTLTNTTPNSLMVGFNSNIPTLFIGPSQGIGTTGVVSIGKERIISGSHTDYKLSVDGKLVARKIIGTELNWGDDEFHKKLTLDSLHKEEEFIMTSGHLQGIPSGQEIAVNGIDFGEMSAMQMRKIERLYLYSFLFDKTIHSLTQQNDALKKENIAIRKDNEQIEEKMKLLMKRVEVLEERH